MVSFDFPHRGYPKHQMWSAISLPRLTRSNDVKGGRASARAGRGEYVKRSGSKDRDVDGARSEFEDHINKHKQMGLSKTQMRKKYSGEGNWGPKLPWDAGATKEKEARHYLRQ